MIVASPTATAVTLPLLSTVAAFVLLLTHVTFLFAASDGVIVALNVTGSSPTRMVRRLGVTLTPLTEIALTVTAQVACFPLPSCTVAVMVALPTPAAVTTPPLTVAIVASLVVHFTEASETVLGSTVAFSVAVPPFSSASAVLSSVTSVASRLTVTVHWAVFPSAVAVTTAFPASRAVIVIVPVFVRACSSMV